MSLRSVVFASFAALAVCGGAHATTFGLEGSLGATPTFSVTSGGTTATFSSPASTFVVQDTTNLFTFTTGLVDQSATPDSLTITFSAPVSGTIDIPFGIEDLFGSYGNDTLTVLANTSQTATYTGVLDNLFFAEPEGVAAFITSAPVTSLTLTGGQSFGIGDITTVAPTPEPTSLALLGTGLAGIMLRRRRA
jgi:hypothetical protein